MTAPLRWPENAETVRMNSLSNIRRLREILRNIQRLSREIEVVKDLGDAIEYTHMIENELLSVGPRAEKEYCNGGH